jgi:hypothetical protein
MKKRQSRDRERIPVAWSAPCLVSVPHSLLAPGLPPQFFGLRTSFLGWGCGSGVCTQSFTLARQVLYGLSQSSSPGCFLPS